MMFYRHGWHSWSPTRWVDPTIPPTPVADEVRRHNQYHPVQPFDTTHGSSGVGAIERPGGTIELLGCLGGDATVRVEEGRLAGDGTSDWFSCEASEDAAFAAYADALGQALGRRGGDPPRVWCSWYSYYTDVTADDVVDAVDGYADMPFDVIQIDDGWQRTVGDWLPNDRFPVDLSSLTDRIRRGGKEPGLWLAPFIAHEGSAVARDHADMLLHDLAGNRVIAGWNWGGAYFPLDVTNPIAAEYIVETIERAIRWGFRYLKLDFLYAASYPGARHRETTDPFRIGSQLIREAAGDSAYLLACGAPIIGSIGIFDGIRIGPDTEKIWEDPAMRDIDDESAPGARSAIMTSVLRTWLKPVIDVDPDVVYFRSDAGALSPGTKRRLTDLAHICGFRATSDPPASLSPQERRDLEEFLRTDHELTKTGRYSWIVDGRPVDFAPAFEQRTEPDWAS